MGKGLFGSVFDLNGDGKMSAFEHAAEFLFIRDVVMADKKDDDGLFGSGRCRDEWNWADEDEDEDERAEALEDAGLDADDFDDLF